MRDISKILIVDLESTCWDNRQNPNQVKTGEIIEIGICTINTKTLEISDPKSIVIRPERTEVSEFCTKLTGWTQKDVNKGVSLEEACGILRKEYNSRNRAWASYGQWDRDQFDRECSEKSVLYPFGKFHINIKGIVEHIFGETLGMSQALVKFNLPLIGRHHNGLDDAKNIAAMYSAILRKARSAQMQEV